MRYVVDISQPNAALIDRLIKEGRYGSVAQFIATAIENQIYLETSDQPSIRTTKDSKVEGPKRSTLNRPLSLISKSHDGAGYQTVTTLNLKLPQSKRLPATFSTPRFDELVTSLSSRHETEPWLWGQINRILPIKVGLRTLYLLLIDLGGPIELDQFRDRAADLAFAVGEMIREHEEKKGKQRDERISAGLPGGNEPFKSKARYKTHFLSYMRKDGKLDGAMSLLKFANVQKDTRGRVLIALTEAGAHFASLENPPMDRGDLDRSLSEQEIHYYLKHIRTNVPGEFNAIKWLLRTILAGVMVRDEINKKLKNEMGSVWRASDAVINTQRAGLTSRAAEVGLIKTIKSGIGVSVQYEVTDQGRTILERTQT